MATQNSIDKKSGELTIDPGASGDSFIQLDINTVSEFRIGVDDTDDSFRISQGSALGTTDTFVMTAAGELSLPLQPAFSAELSTDLFEVTGDGTVVTITFDSEFFDQSGDYNSSTGVFSAPVTGRYSFLMYIATFGELAGGFISIVVETSNRAFEQQLSQSTALVLGGHCLAFADMDLGDTAIFKCAVTTGAKSVTIFNFAGTMVSGYLVC